jgi:hypothetical protein
MDKLEHVLKGELYLPLRPGLGLKCGAGDGAERRVAGSRIRQHSGPWEVKIWMICQIEDLSSELQSLAFRDFEGAVETQIKVS